MISNTLSWIIEFIEAICVIGITCVIIALIVSYLRELIETLKGN